MSLTPNAESQNRTLFPGSGAFRRLLRGGKQGRGQHFVAREQVFGAFAVVGKRVGAVQAVYRCVQIGMGFAKYGPHGQDALLWRLFFVCWN